MLLTKPHCMLLTMLMFMPMWLLQPSMATGATSASDKDGVVRTVALDPGHGGDDEGARGPTGSLEKKVCLDLARILAGQLESRYQVALTRSGDYSVSLAHRTAAANHHAADILISIHCGAGYQHTATGMAVYYWKPLVEPSPAEQREADSDRWDQVQLHHLAASHALARGLQQSLQSMAGAETVQVNQAPLLVLQGADMPAVLIEIGHITHPATEKDLLSPQWQQQLARAIRTGIEIFSEKQLIKP